MKTTKKQLTEACESFFFTLRWVTGGTKEETLRQADTAIADLERKAAEIERLAANPNKHCMDDTWLMERCKFSVPSRLREYRENYVGKYEAWKAEQEAKRQALGTHDNPVRYEHLNKADPQYREKFKAQCDQFQADAKAGKVLCLSDLMISAGM